MPTDRGPIPNSYQLREGRLIAGEYPGALDPIAVPARLRPLLEAGVTTFVDLTEPGELRPYESVMEAVADEVGVSARHVRHPIRDVSVPKSPLEMRQILDTIDVALGTPGKVYVHCWGGIGRTGTVVGCHLVRQGLTGEAALARIAELWKSVEKHTRRPRSPETDEQADYVRSWSEMEPM